MSLLPTKKTSGKVALMELRLLIYGPPKIGKTNFISGWPNVLILATEKGYTSQQVYAKDIEDWDTFKKIRKELSAGKHKFDAVAIDTVDILYKLCTEYVCNKMGIEHVSDEDWGKGYSAVETEFDKEINALFMSDMGIIMVSHTKIQDFETPIGKSSKIVPTLTNQGRRLVIPKVDVIGCMQMKTVKQSEGNYKDYRIITFKPSSVVEAGDRTGRLPKELRVYKDAVKTFKELEKIYKSERRDD